MLLSACAHNAKDLESIFAGQFSSTYQTILSGGADEPLYSPANDADSKSIIYYREDYFASALHEVAHWCIAGEQRLKQIDFGYWYLPDGRNTAQQEAFQQAEIKPQALEMLFSIASNYPFKISIDNLSASDLDNGATSKQNADEVFKQAVLEQAKNYCRNGLPARGQTFYTALVRYYSASKTANPDYNCTSKNLALIVEQLYG